jgi:ABC-2 type transport system ATP-binding protein
MLVGVTLPNGGSIRYFGKELHSNREYCLTRMNFASAFNTLQGRITVRENLLVFGHLYGVRKPERKIAELAEYFSIVDLLDQRFITLSAGQKTRVNLAKSLINDPEIVLMDEPTASLDPDIADRTLSLIETLRASRNLSVVYTSHEMDEVSRICDDVIFLDRGNIVAEGTPSELTRDIARAQLRVTFRGDRDAVAHALAPRFSDVELGHNVVVITTDDREVPRAVMDIGAAGVEVIDIDLKKATLEDLFLQIARGDRHVA